MNTLKKGCTLRKISGRSQSDPFGRRKGAYQRKEGKNLSLSVQ